MKEGKSAVLAAILSLLIPGLGHFYLGIIGKGFMFLILEIVGWILTGSIFGMFFVIPMLFILPIWACIDAYIAAQAA